jgi:acetyl esterase/lipase
MKQRGGIVWVLLLVLGLLLGVAAVLHWPETHHLAAALHSAHAPGAVAEGETGSRSEATARALDGVAKIGRRWDEAAYAETVALYTAVHRELEWPGVLEPETIQYGPDAQQTFSLYRPEQGFSEPGPVMLFMHGNGLGNGDRIAAGSDGLMYSHLGKLAATFGGIGVSMDYRAEGNDDIGAGPMLEAGAEDLRLVIEWLAEHIAPYGGDPNTIVLLAHSEGATRAAAYLFNESWQMASGPGLAAVVLVSGHFGDLDSEIAEAAIAYNGERVPLALWSAEYDPPEVTASVADLHELLCRKYAGCPWREQIHGHNHVSQVMSLGTDDTDPQYRLIRFYHTVR